MEIICTDRHAAAYRPMFGGNLIPMEVATVTFDIPGDGKTVMTFSNRADENIWLADSRIGPGGFPVFVHGQGDRSCSKQIAGPQIVEAIEAVKCAPQV